MSLRKRQLSRAVDAVIERSVKAGFYPKLETVTYRLIKELGGRILGAPSMRLRPARTRGRSSSADYNETFREIHQDLEDLYAESRSITRQVLANFRSQDAQRERLRRRIRALGARLDRLLLLAKDSPGLIDYFYDTFSDLSKVDMSLQGVPPSPATTAYVDTRLAEVRLKESRPPHRLNLADARISLVLPEGATQLSPASCITDENTNTGWLVKVPFVGGQVSVSVTVDFSQEFELNTVLVRQHSPRPVEIFVEALSGGSWTPVGMPAVVEFERSFTCRDLRASALRLTLTKREPDEAREEKICYFGLRDLAVMNVAYAEEGVFVSTIHSSEVPISRLALEVDEEVPAGAGIQYFVAFPTGTGRGPWTPVIPIHSRDGAVLDLMNVSRFDLAVDQSYPGYGQVYGTVNGITFYKVADLPEEPKPGSVFLQLGSGQLERVSFVNQETYDAEGDGHIPVPGDFLTDAPKTVGAFDFARRLPFQDGLPAETAGGFYKFKLYVDSDAHYDLPLGASWTGCNPVFCLNGRRESGVLRFVPGVNVFEVLVYKHTGVPPEVELGQELYDFLTARGVRSARGPMTFVDSHALFYEISPAFRNCFTVVERSVVVNFRPTTKFKLSYSTVLEEQRSVVFMARLFRAKEAPGETPRLRSYRLRVS